MSFAEAYMSFDGQNRRHYPRVRAPVFFQSARFRSSRVPVTDIGLGGLRVYSDDPFRLGERLDIELFLPDASSLRCLVRVVWIVPLEGGDPANYDVGLQLLTVDGDGLKELARVVDFDA
ncbi:MAG: PilZ domain-containing protein [Deltaproteobacteria bacterium]|nr:PilZ domain-containing protein [Deltaproteobacteria bacterium]